MVVSTVFVRVVDARVGRMFKVGSRHAVVTLIGRRERMLGEGSGLTRLTPLRPG